MDLDVFVTAHRAEWDRLEQLLGRGRKLTGDEADELVALYQRTSTHLSQIQSSAPDPMLTGRLTQLVARARATVTGTRRAAGATPPSSSPQASRPRSTAAAAGGYRRPCSPRHSACSSAGG